MTGSITLTASMRSNLTSLRTIASQMSQTQERLSSGKKVNSAIDNASSYYQARALTNRAADLNALLDSMGQGIQTIQAANEGLEAGLNFVEQAKTVVETFLAETPDDFNITFVDTVTSLKAALADNNAKNIVVTKSLTFDENDTITVASGKKLSGLTSDISLSFTNTTAGSVTAIKNRGTISDLTVYYTRTQESGSGAAVSGGVIEGKVNVHAQGQQTYGIESATINGIVNVTTDGKRSYGIGSCTVNGTANISTKGQYAYGALIGRINGAVNVITDGGDANGLMSSSLYGTANIITLQNSSEALQYGDVYGTVNTNLAPSGDHKGWYATTFKEGAVFNGVAEGYSHPATSEANVTLKLALTNDENLTEYLITEELALNNAPGSIQAYKTGNKLSKDAFLAKFNATMDAAQAEIEDPEVSFDEKTMDVYKTHQEYVRILGEYDNLIADTSYQGINLLNGSDLTVTFDENRNHNYTVYGVDATASGLNISAESWQTKEDVKNSIAELDHAVQTMRAYAEIFGNSYQIIQTRQNFTEAMTDILETGADNLVLADMNEESADYLSLQVRNNLAINALALASQSAQSVLKLF